MTDQSGNEHLGIIEFPVPILRGSPEIIKQIREKLYQPDFQDLTVVDFSDLAQGCKTYNEFIEKIGHVPESTLRYFGIASILLTSLLFYLFVRIVAISKNCSNTAPHGSAAKGHSAAGRTLLNNWKAGGFPAIPS